MPGRHVGRVLAGRTYGTDLEFRKRLQGGDMGNGGKSPLRTCPYNPHADFAPRRHDIRLLIGSMLPDHSPNGRGGGLPKR